MIFIFIYIFATPATAKNLSDKLPPTPQLPKSGKEYADEINGIYLHYLTYGHGQPVILLHGGLANANYWGLQVRKLQRKYNVIVVDSRGHGLSANDNSSYSYKLMSEDIIALMDRLKIRRANIIGWSDGAIIGLEIAINHPDRLNKLFAFAATFDVTGTTNFIDFGKLIQHPDGFMQLLNFAFNPKPNDLADIIENNNVKEYLSRTEDEYKKSNLLKPSFEDFFKSILKMWISQPAFTTEELESIKARTCIVVGDQDEFGLRAHTEKYAGLIPNSKLIIIKNVGHFAFLQSPDEFTSHIIRCFDNQ